MHNKEPNPKQLIAELVLNSSKILIISSNKVNNDKYGAMFSLSYILNSLGKETKVVISTELPRAKNIIGQDFITTKAKYKIVDSKLQLNEQEFAFDLVFTIGVEQIADADELLINNSNLFDGFHLINIDTGRNNQNFGSINYIDSRSSGNSEIMVSLIESMGQKMINKELATALLIGLYTSTNRFTNYRTTPKSMTVAAQLVAQKVNISKLAEKIFDEKHSNK